MSDYDRSRDPKPAGSAQQYGSIIEAARENSRRDNLAHATSFRAEQDDQRFLCGHQWDETDRLERDDQGLVTLTINDLGQFLDQVVGDMRQNPTAIKIAPGDFGASKAKFVSTSGRTYTAAEVRAGLIKQIEYKSNAVMHYNLAGQHAAETGRGWLRVYSDWIDDASFVQDICIERIKNRWSVLGDSMATQPDRSDMKHAFLGSWMTRAEFEKEHPGVPATPIGSEANVDYWGKDGYVKVAEYYYLEPITYELLQIDNGALIRSIDPAYEAARVSGRVVNQRKVRSHQVMWCKMTYDEMIEKPRKLPGSRIPLVPVLGKVIEGSQDDFIYGLFRFAKQPKMMENYWLSSATQRIAQMPSAPWLVTDVNVAGRVNEWAEANRASKAYLAYTPDPENGNAPPQRVQHPPIPAAELQLIMQFADKVKSSVGFHDAAIGRERNQQSGIAIQRLQQESDVGAFVFTDNLRMAIGSVGKIISEWIPSVYDTERFITVRHPNDEIDVIEINKIADDGTLTNDLSEGKFDSMAMSGPAYTTLREEAAVAGMELMKALASVGDGRAVGAIADVAVENMDFPGHDRIAKRLRKLVPPHLIDQTEMTEEERNAPPPPPSPEQMAAQKEAEAQARQAEADMAKANAQLDTADATRATARANIAQATANIMAALSPKPAPAAGGEGKPAAKAPAIDPAVADLVRELVLNTIAEQIASAQQPAPAPATPAPQPAPGASNV